MNFNGVVCWMKIFEEALDCEPRVRYNERYQITRKNQVVYYQESIRELLKIAPTQITPYHPQAQEWMPDKEANGCMDEPYLFLHCILFI